MYTFKRIAYISLVLLFLSAIALRAQTNLLSPLHVGDDLSDISLTGLTNHSSPNAHIRDFRGKIILLDFWSTGCSSCIAAFPKMEGLQAQFKDQLQIIMMNPFEDDAKIAVRTADKRFSWFRDFKMPALPSTTGDSLWKQRFPTHTVPHHVWIGKDGRILAITNGHNATPEIIKALLAGEPLKLNLKSTLEYDLRHTRIATAYPGHARHIGPHTIVGPYFGGEGASSYGQYTSRPVVDSSAKTLRLSFVNVPFMDVITCLFAFKKQGANYPRLNEAAIYWDISSPQWFQKPTDNSLRDDWARRTAICLETELPMADSSTIADEALQSLDHYLQQTYRIQVTFPLQTVPCKVLQIADRSRIPVSSGKWDGKTLDTAGMAQYHYINAPFSSISHDIMFSLGATNWSHTRANPQRPIIVMDETALTDTVSMVLPYSATFPVDQPVTYADLMSKALKSYGIELKDATRETQVIRISEAPIPAIQTTLTNAQQL